MGARSSPCICGSNMAPWSADISFNNATRSSVAASATSLSAGCDERPWSAAARSVAQPYLVTPPSPCSNRLPFREYKCDAARYKLDARSAASGHWQHVMASAPTNVKNAALRGKHRRDEVELLSEPPHCVSLVPIKQARAHAAATSARLRSSNPPTDTARCNNSVNFRPLSIESKASISRTSVPLKSSFDTLVRSHLGGV
mmetsp:Transcript_16660/g.35994  ORF Transcript_16660/g.35994 Transcript_16660/m.35994 type:complete len:200 (-) Transcript_16660:2219-2818(-)